MEKQEAPDIIHQERNEKTLLSEKRKRIFAEIFENYTGKRLWEHGGKELLPKAHEVLGLVKTRFGEILKEKKLTIIHPESGGDREDSSPTQILYGHGVRSGAIEITGTVDDILKILSPKTTTGEIESFIQEKFSEIKNQNLSLSEAA